MQPGSGHQGPRRFAILEESFPVLFRIFDPIVTATKLMIDMLSRFLDRLRRYQGKVAISAAITTSWSNGKPTANHQAQASAIRTRQARSASGPSLATISVMWSRVLRGNLLAGQHPDRKRGRNRQGA
jgi:hypothetical protein